MIKMYLARSFFGNTITEVEVARATESSIWDNNNRRHARKTWGEMYCDTWKDAYEYLLKESKNECEKIKINIQYAEEGLARAIKKYEELKTMKEPE